MFLGLTEKQISDLEYEVVPKKLRRNLTRVIRKYCRRDEAEIQLILYNKYINLAKTVLDEPIYHLKCDDMGEYMAAEHAWHNAQIELIMRRPNTVQLVEILADMLQEYMLNIDEINMLLISHNCSFRFKFDDDIVIVKIIPTQIITNNNSHKKHHPNIRTLVARMENAQRNKDYTNVLHTSASIFETLAKEVIADHKTSNQTFGSFFEKYKKKSNLPDSIIDYMLKLYKKRNKEPLAGHGSLNLPTVTEEESIIIVEMTKAFINIEVELINHKVSEKKIGY